MNDNPGKNFSRNRPRAERMEADFYQTPHCLTQAFIDAHVKRHWEGVRDICDFCSGDGAITAVLRKNGYYAEYSDKKTGTDFFDIHLMENFGIMNPPFRLFNKWVEHCMDIFQWSFALLAPTTYLQGIARYNGNARGKGIGLFQNPYCPITHIYTFNRYPMLSAQLREDGLINTGMQALSWFVWTRNREPGRDPVCPDTIHRWLDIDKFVLRKGRKSSRQGGINHEGAFNY